MNLTIKDNDRFSGILAHPTSFPSPYGIGDMGSGAYAFIDFLKASGQSLWQCLPLGPTGFGDSPYQSFSSFAGQPLIISPELLGKDGLLVEKDFSGMPEWNPEYIIYGESITFKEQLLKKAYSRFKEKDMLLYIEEFHTFCKANRGWLNNYALFMAIKEDHNGASWLTWEDDLKHRCNKALAEVKTKLLDVIDYYKFIQFIFFRQWLSLKQYANKNNIRVIGDIPIFVSPDSADVWAHQELFELDEDGFPTVVAGVPPDYFSATGQLWGNPLYKWDAHKTEHYHWWTSRIKHQLTLVDMLRIDHFRGFEAYWAIPYGEKTAVLGQWVNGPRADFFDAVTKALGANLPIIAEDLGIITPSVEALRDAYGFPGMRVLQFGFDNTDENDYLPHNFIPNCVCYTGTHDNDTTAGWYSKASESSRDKVRRYMNTDGSSVHWDFIRTALASTAQYAVFPLQDVFGLGSDCRMNTPGIAEDNWTWRFTKDALNDGLAAHLKELSELFGRKGAMI